MGLGLSGKVRGVEIIFEWGMSCSSSGKREGREVEDWKVVGGIRMTFSLRTVAEKVLGMFSMLWS